MKLIITTIFCIFISAKNFGQPTLTAGRLKISIENIKCINKSWDGVIEFDGHGNEISVNFSYRIYSPSNPNAVRKGVGGTPIFGSNINGMTRAGTQTPDLGGITNGDVVNISKLIMDDHINADEYIIIAPTVWEWDSPENNTFNNFNAQLETDLTWATNQTYPFSNSAVSYSDPFAGRVVKIFDVYHYGAAIKYHNTFKNILCPLNAQGNRAIGIIGAVVNPCTVIYPPTLLVLDTRVLSALASNNYSASQTSAGHPDRPDYITGLDIPFVENTYAIETSNGNYSLRLKIEFIRDITTETTPTITKTKTLPVKNNTIKTENTVISERRNNSVVPVTGIWAGTQTNDYGLSPENIGFELTGNSEFLMKDNVGTVAAKGTYTFSNNIINISFKSLSSGDTNSLTGTFDPGTQKLSCTLGMSPSTTGQGRWVVTKQ